VADGETGLLAEGAEPKAVALAVARLLCDGPMRERMGRAGRSRVQETFTWPRRAGRLADILAHAAG
jgi:glycosyltransferase involved in cell wall biosynthesis